MVLMVSGGVGTGVALAGSSTGGVVGAGSSVAAVVSTGAVVAAVTGAGAGAWATAVGDEVSSGLEQASRASRATKSAK